MCDRSDHIPEEIPEEHPSRANGVQWTWWCPLKLKWLSSGISIEARKKQQQCLKEEETHQIKISIVRSKTDAVREKIALTEVIAGQKLEELNNKLAKYNRIPKLTGAKDYGFPSLD